MFPFTPPNWPRTVEIIMCLTLNCALLCSGSIFQLTACAEAFATSTTPRTNRIFISCLPSRDRRERHSHATNYFHPALRDLPEAWVPANRCVEVSPPASPRCTRTPPRQSRSAPCPPVEPDRKHPCSNGASACRKPSGPE